MNRRLYDYDEAAEELRVTRTWLERHIKSLPHVAGLGGRVFFTDAHLDQILADRDYQPPAGPSRAVKAGSSLVDLKPLPSRRRA